MANITISDLRPAGADLFSDSESYMHDLTDNELNVTQGGLSLPCVIIITITITTTLTGPILTNRT